MVEPVVPDVAEPMPAASDEVMPALPSIAPPVADASGIASVAIVSVAALLADWSSFDPQPAIMSVQPISPATRILCMSISPMSSTSRANVERWP
jgi:hypothetical protein